IDFDFFGRTPFDPLLLFRTIPYLRDGRIVQSADSTLTALVERGERVQVSYFATPRLGQVAPHRAAEGVSVASLIDLAALKCVVVQSRAESKDFIDLDALIEFGVPLPMALAAASIIQGATFNPYVTLKALSYFDDGDLPSLSPAVRKRLQAAVRDVAFPLPRVEAYVQSYTEEGLS
ncbi:MAG: nucleotidyl transferase AbiEii/AbiGii toxin family protein, partial [Parvularculaceae bacterium]|nr:nucleotidyl transferase AbiEii/AbiGii toxin family protein [Parvularculaceae bacterium]